jgi:hypothetical protein
MTDLTKCAFESCKIAIYSEKNFAILNIMLSLHIFRFYLTFAKVYYALAATCFADLFIFMRKIAIKVT